MVESRISGFSSVIGIGLVIFNKSSSKRNFFFFFAIQIAFQYTFLLLVAIDTEHLKD